MRSKSWRLSIVPALLLMFSPALSLAQISVSVSIAPPELPVYDQPPIPGDGYIWTPGYWAWGDDIQDYYWVPGTWVEAPQPEYLWTPGYWGAEGAVFIWHAGYWGPQVGFYGGVDYGYGYGGHGYEGGYWRDGHLFYNRAVVNVGSAHITNVYNKTVVNNISVTRVSFNGGNGGVRAQATAQEMAAARERHIEATSVQREHAQTARGNPALRASSNHGHPPIAATPRAGNFSNPVPARNAVPTGRSADRTNEREPPQPRLSTPRERTETAPNREAAPNRNVAPPAREVHPIAPREAAPPREPTPPREREHAAPAEHPAPQQHVTPPRPPTPVEPRRQPEHTEARPAPQPPARPAPRPAEPPKEHPVEHPEQHEHQP
jgi:hypothetical protein